MASRITKKCFRYMTDWTGSLSRYRSKYRKSPGSKQAFQAPLTRQQIHNIAESEGYQESALEIVPRLLEGDWKFLEPQADGR